MIIKLILYMYMCRFCNSVKLLPGDGDLGVLTLEVCNDDVSCISCGEIASFLPGEWVSRTCPEETIGNQITIQSSGSALQLCEVQFHGEGYTHCAL